MELLGTFRLPITLAVALGLSLYFTPVIRRGALKYGVVDTPDGRLKVHSDPVAYLGGVAVFLSFLFALAATYDFTERVLALLLASSIIVMLGLFDDLKVLNPGAKILGQLVATVVLVKAGVMIQLSFIPEPVALVLTCVWLVGTTNSINLIDVSDGLAAGVAVIAAAFLSVVAAWNGADDLAVMSVALIGATLGFLAFNRPPASIYLGDTGSMFLGFMLGALAMTNHYTFVHPYGALAPILILGVPIFDTLFVMAVRRAKGRPVMQGSPDHFAVRLRKAGFGRWPIAGTGYGAGGLLGTGGLTICLVDAQMALAIFGGLLLLTTVVVVALLRIRV
jgi:UDP-GlcNAc:undecaprenyl-phosphate/decaprenyl-phosphate GlcNAc-1-phosphate transferase